MWRCWRHPYPCAMRYSSALAPAMARNGSFVGGGSELASLLLPIEASRQRSHPLESLPNPTRLNVVTLGGLRCRCADLKIFSPNKVHANHPPKKENDEFLYVFMPPFPLSHWVPLVSRHRATPMSPGHLGLSQCILCRARTSSTPTVILRALPYSG